jgi:hypothetical protein
MINGEEIPVIQCQSPIDIESAGSLSPVAPVLEQIN